MLAHVLAAFLAAVLVHALMLLVLRWGRLAMLLHLRVVRVRVGCRNRLGGDQHCGHQGQHW
jgi:hypothetical protein